MAGSDKQREYAERQVKKLEVAGFNVIIMEFNK